MPSIMFSFRPDTPSSRREELFREMRSWPGVVDANVLFPATSDEALGRAAFASVENSSRADAVVSQLIALPEIERAELAATRRL